MLICRLAALKFLSCALLTISYCSVSFADEPKLLDTVHLRTGGMIQGRVQELTEGKKVFYLVETADGAFVKLNKRQVRRVTSPTATTAATNVAAAVARIIILLRIGSPVR